MVKAKKTATATETAPATKTPVKKTKVVKKTVEKEEAPVVVPEVAEAPKEELLRTTLWSCLPFSQVAKYDPIDYFS